MAPIRVGIIGLSKSAATSWASAAHFPYLVASEGKYEIKALCNSSKESAQKAIEGYSLPSTTKAYGNPQDLANDPDIDLVVCSTRVDVHYKTIKPSVEAGKDVFVEWPLTSNVQDSEELVRLANQKKIKTMIGLQGRVSPIYLKVKEMIEGGRIGEVLSSSITASGATKYRDSIGESLTYFFDRHVGGNLFTIYIGHLTDSISSVLGPINPKTSNLSLLRPDVKILSASGEVLRTIKSDVPDRFQIEGFLPSFSNAPISISLRRSTPFKGTPGFIWSIEGSKGEIRVEADGTSIHAFEQNAKILVEDFEKSGGEVENVPWDDPMADRGFKGPARNIGSLYEAFAAADAEGEKKGAWPTFEDALERHRLLEAVWGDWHA